MIDVIQTGIRIRDLIHSSDYSVNDVADYLGTSNTSIYRYLRGAVLPSIDRLLLLSHLLGVTINDILVTI